MHHSPSPLLKGLTFSMVSMSPPVAWAIGTVPYRMAYSWLRPQGSNLQATRRQCCTVTLHRQQNILIRHPNLTTCSRRTGRLHRAASTCKVGIHNTAHTTARPHCRCCQPYSRLIRLCRCPWQRYCCHIGAAFVAHLEGIRRMSHPAMILWPSGTLKPT